MCRTGSPCTGRSSGRPAFAPKDASAPEEAAAPGEAAAPEDPEEAAAPEEAASPEDATHGFSRVFFYQTSALGRVSRTEWSKNVTNNNQLVLKTTSNRNCGPEAV